MYVLGLCVGVMRFRVAR